MLIHLHLNNESPAHNTDETATLTVISWNINKDAPTAETQKSLETLNKLNPDLILIQEYSEENKKIINNVLSPKYITDPTITMAYNTTNEFRSGFGIATFVRGDLQPETLISLKDKGDAVFHQKIKAQKGNKNFCIVNVHILPPIIPSFMNSRLSNFKEIGSDMSDCVYIGDFNATKWDPIFKELRHVKNQKISAQSITSDGLSWEGLGLIKLDLDHAVFSPTKLTVLKTNTEILNKLKGSDHTPQEWAIVTKK